MPVFLGFPGGSAGKESACNAGDLGWEDPLEKRKTTHSSIPTWRIPWTVQSMTPWTKSQNTTERLSLHYTLELICVKCPIYRKYAVSCYYCCHYYEGFRFLEIKTSQPGDILQQG